MTGILRRLAAHLWTSNRRGWSRPRCGLCEAAGKCSVFWQTRALEPYHLRAPEQLEVKAHDGTTLYATLLLPEGATERGKRSADRESVWRAGAADGVESLGATACSSTSCWRSMDLRCCTPTIAARAIAGAHFAQAAYHNFGPVQLEDQLTVVDAVLAQYPQLDPKRLGWWGWSWGGTFTLYAHVALRSLSRRSCGGAGDRLAQLRLDLYRALHERAGGVSPTATSDFSVVNSAANLKGRLLLAHGTGDDNVHMENTVQYVQKLIEAGIPYDLQIYPRKTHSIAGPDVRTHLYNRILAQFEEYLKPPARVNVSWRSREALQSCAHGRLAARTGGIEVRARDLRAHDVRGGGKRSSLSRFGQFEQPRQESEQDGDAHRDHERRGHSRSSDS